MESESRGLDLEKELTCSICTEVFFQPLTLLDCLHTFCGSCLKEWFGWQLSSFKNRPSTAASDAFHYTCPSCRAHVRDTKHNATVTTLLEMYLAANPDKARTPAEQDELKAKYKPGENVLPQPESRHVSRRERYEEDEDRRLVEEVRELSLQEVGVSARRRHRTSSQVAETRIRPPAEHRERSRDARSGDGRERRRDDDPERRRRRTETTAPSSTAYREERRRQRNEDEARRRQEEMRPARQIEHQSSLRSLISLSDIDSREMEEEILRQIHDEGLLDGIDLENLDPTQEEQVTERIAAAFRRRQEEKAREEARRRRTRAHSSDERPSAHARQHSRTVSVDGRQTRSRDHSRTPSSASQADEARPQTSSAHLEVNAHRERRRRRSTGARSATIPPASMVDASHPASRSQSDLSDAQSPQDWVPTEGQRRTTDPIPSRSPRRVEATAESPRVMDSPRQPETQVQPAIPDPASHADSPVPEIIRSPATPSVELDAMSDLSLVPAPLSPRHSTVLDRSMAVQSGSRPLSSGSQSRPQTFEEPSITCSRCHRPHIEYELHYNCFQCNGGKWNICLSCYRTGKGCLHWFGFGRAAQMAWQRKMFNGEIPGNSEQPHMLFASRYAPPKSSEGGATGYRSRTTENPEKRLQSGSFCSNCQAWANECFWLCDHCNDGDWGFCNSCVNQGKCCTHPLLPLAFQPDSHSPPTSPTQEHQTPAAATILTGPGVADNKGRFKPLTFRTKCDICRYAIPPADARYHCYKCTSTVPRSTPGDYDICSACYHNLVTKHRLSAENGPAGWRRCLQGHRLVVLRFLEDRGAEYRVVAHEQVGGHMLREEDYSSDTYPAGQLARWSWHEGAQWRLVTSDVAGSVTPSSAAPTPSLGTTTAFPPDGGTGARALAAWAWYPQADDANSELLFPRGAEVRECHDQNGDWWAGVYMGVRGIFPSPYVRLLPSSTAPAKAEGASGR